jgi:hypothetical protein
MASGRAILQAHVDGLLPESIPIDVQWTLASGVLGIVQTALASGDNTLTVPAGTDLIVLIPPTISSATLVWSKTGGATTGIIQPPNAPNIVGYSSGAVIVNANTTVTPVTIIYLG